MIALMLSLALMAMATIMREFDSRWFLAQWISSILIVVSFIHML